MNGQIFLLHFLYSVISCRSCSVSLTSLSSSLMLSISVLILRLEVIPIRRILRPSAMSGQSTWHCGHEFLICSPCPQTQIPRHGRYMQGDSRLGARVSVHRLFTFCRWVSQTHLLILHRLDDFSVPIVLDHSVREQRMLRE